MMAALAAVLAALFAALATVAAAVQSRRANNATVDVRILKYLQEDVVALQDRVAVLRASVREAQDETDQERARRRRLELELAGLQDLAQRMARALEAAGIPIPESSLMEPAGAPQITTGEH